MDLVVVDDDAALCARAAELIVETVDAAVTARGQAMVCLAGGKTPAQTYARLAARHRSGADWSRVGFWWNDERCVSADHPESNYGMAARALLGPLAIPPAHVHRMRGELPPEAGVEHYETELRAAFPAGPAFDLLLLGLGDDAHVASLFPGHPALEETVRLVVPVEVDAAVRHRLTLTLPVLNAAAEIVFLVSGTRKAEAVRRVLDGPPAGLPAQRIQPARGRVTWLLDRAARDV